MHKASPERENRLEHLQAFLERQTGRAMPVKSKQKLTALSPNMGAEKNQKNEKTDRSKAVTRTASQKDIHEKEEDEDGTRSVKAEIDYSNKSAARHIVTDQTSKKQKLRDKVMKNLDWIRTGQRPSEASLKSLQSRITQTSKAAMSNKVELEPISEDASEAQLNDPKLTCEVCSQPCGDPQDIELNQ